MLLTFPQTAKTGEEIMKAVHKRWRRGEDGVRTLQRRRRGAVRRRRQKATG